jgi:hypothetical protein
MPDRAEVTGWIRTSVLPLVNGPTSSSSFQFLFSHVFEFSFIPASIAGLANARFKHKAAQPLFLHINSLFFRCRGLSWTVRHRCFPSSQPHFTNTSAGVF